MQIGSPTVTGTTAGQPQEARALAIFRDTVGPGQMKIDGSFEGVIAYGDGDFAWPAAQVDRYVSAGKHLYRYEVTGYKPHLGSILDVERYDATPAEAAVWVPQRNDIEPDAGCYVSLDGVPELLDHIGDEPCWLVVADWTGTPHVPHLELPSNVKLAAVQYASLPNLGYDLLAVYSADWLAGRRV